MDNSTYIKLLIIKDCILNTEEQTNILNFLFDTFVQYSKDTLYIYDGIIKKVKSKQAFQTMVKMVIKLEFDIEICVYDSKSKKYKWLLKIDELYDTLTTVNSYEMLVYEYNLFANKQVVLKDDLTGIIKVIGNKIHIKELQKNVIDKDDYNLIVQDYKNHFPFFDEFLNLIMDMRFAKNRKASFLHLRVKSDWGKSFLSGLLQNLEIGIEIDYHNLMNKGANDISPVQVRNSFVLMLDEFNVFSQEMKKLSHSFTFAPKFGMSETVELYLKILFSAEKSPSFVGGVDDQIINRIIVFDIPDDKAIKLTEREVFLNQGSAKYMRALEYYAHNILKNKLENYLKMDELEAYKLADDRVRETYKKYKMVSTSLATNVSDIINDTILSIIENETENPNYQKIKKDIIKIENDKYSGNYFIQAPMKVFEIILKNETSENEYKKMRFKLNMIEDILDVVEDCRTKAKRINGKARKGLILKIFRKEDVEIEHVKLNEKGNLVDEDGNELF